MCEPGQRRRYSDCATGWTVRAWNSCGGEILCYRPDRPSCSPSLMCSRYRISFPEVKRSGRGVVHLPLSNVEVKVRIELYFSSLSGPSCPVLRWTLRYPTRKCRSKSVMSALGDLGLLSLIHVPDRRKLPVALRFICSCWYCNWPLPVRPQH
jgi:hypothetical protein